jgi:hypothetical protein
MSATVFLYLFLKLVTELVILIVGGTCILFHSSITLIEKMFLLTSSLAACCLNFTSCCQVGLVSSHKLLTTIHSVISVQDFERLICRVWTPLVGESGSGTINFGLETGPFGREKQ